MNPSDVRTATDVVRLARLMFHDSLQSPIPVMHVVAVWGGAAAGYVVMNIGPESPKSQYDFFVLNLVRARADAIVTTGQILRDEPDLRHTVDGPGEAGRALRAWRAEILELTSSPHSLVLTSGRDLDPEHPLFQRSSGVVIYTTTDAATRLRGSMGNTEVVGVAKPGLESACRFLRTELGAASLSVEAGMSTARVLYADTVKVDQLFLSVFGGPSLPAAVQGKAFLSPTYIGRHLRPLGPAFSADEASGPWRFIRYGPGSHPT